MLAEIRRHISCLRLEKHAEIGLIAEPEFEGNLLETLSAVSDFAFRFEDEARVQNAGKRHIELLVQNLVEAFRSDTESRSVKLRMPLLAEMLFDHLEELAHALAVLVEGKILLAVQTGDVQEKGLQIGQKNAEIVLSTAFKKHQIDKLLERSHRFFGNSDAGVDEGIEQNRELGLHDAAEKINGKSDIAARRRLSGIGMHLSGSHEVHQSGLYGMRLEVDIMEIPRGRGRPENFKKIVPMVLSHNF